MKLLLFWGYLLCDVLLAWAMLQQPYLSRTLSTPPLKNPHQWTHSVIFEPQPKIQLTQATYKVTSFLDFKPFIIGFQTVNEYLDNLWADILNPYHFRYLFVPIAHIDINPTLNDSHIEKISEFPHVCTAPVCMSSKNEI